MEFPLAVSIQIYGSLAESGLSDTGCNRRFHMIELTKLNGSKVLVNPDLMELVEETPDTVIAFTTGRKIIVKESRQEIKNLVKSYRKDIFAN